LREILVIEIETLDPYDIVLAFLYACGNANITRIHVQKGLYIASKYIEKFNESLEFKAYRMGPWSEEINDVIMQLINNGDLTRDKILQLTERGREKASNSWNKLDENDKKILAKIADFVSKMSVDELLLYVYTVYGEHEKSDVIKSILKKRRSLAINIYLKGLVSLGLAAEMAGMSLPEFIDYMKKRGIKPYEAEEKDLEKVEKL
jgi:predicted HTH domain antitoxin